MPLSWIAKVDGREITVRDQRDFESLMGSEAVRSSSNLTLERVRSVPRPKWERILYRILGLVLPDHESRGAIEIAFSSERASVVFIRDDDDCGAVAVDPERSETESIEFRTEAGEKYREVARETVGRANAQACLAEFFKSGRRPKSLRWQRVNRKATKKSPTRPGGE